MKLSEADIVLRALSEVYSLDDVQRIVDKVCEVCVEITPYRLALLSLYFEDTVYIGLEGGDEEMRRGFHDNATRASEEQRARKRKQIWDQHRIPGTSLCFIPHGSGVPFGDSFQASEPIVGAEWHPEDRLMVFVRGADREVRGVLSLDRPEDGKRPDPNDLGSLRAVDRLVELMGVVIHNKHLAGKLRESEERYAAVVEQGHDGFLIERDGRILFANRQLGRMIGVVPALLIGAPIESVLRKSGGPMLPGEDEGQLLREDGREVDITIRESCIRFGGATAQLVAVADITERKRVFTQLMRAQKMEGVGTLASGIAHDFNNLLGGILGYASLLRARIDDDDALMRYVEAIEQAADRASAVTRQLLGIVRDEQVRVGTFRVGRLLDELTRLFRETLDPSIDIELNCAPRLPLVVGDETQIHQVLLNVGLNARDAMAAGGALRLEADESTEPGGARHVRIRIHDTGVGMDAATVQKIFDPFFTTKEAGEGTGLGLYMAYRVVERHGGFIDVTSTPGAGTTVEIQLPASDAAPSAAPAPADAGDAEGGITVLLVDDEPLMRSVGSEMLERLDYEVITAEDGEQAVERVRHEGDRIGCVILDIAMPVMNGWEAAKHIRALRPRLPIVISSGHDVSEAMGDTHGIDDAHYLKKPYRLSDLLSLLGEVFQGRVRSGGDGTGR